MSKNKFYDMPTDANDVELIELGSITALRPLTEAANDWIAAHLTVEPWQWFAGAVAVEPRYAAAIVEGMTEDGLEVKANV